MNLVIIKDSELKSDLRKPVGVKFTQVTCTLDALEVIKEVTTECLRPAVFELTRIQVKYRGN